MVNKIQRSLITAMGGSILLGMIGTLIDPTFREPAQWVGAALGFAFGFWAQNR